LLAEIAMQIGSTGRDAAFEAAALFSPAWSSDKAHSAAYFRSDNTHSVRVAALSQMPHGYFCRPFAIFCASAGVHSCSSKAGDSTPGATGLVRFRQLEIDGARLKDGNYRKLLGEHILIEE
jgi:hypothetical protein